MSSALIHGVVQQAGKIILGKERQMRLALGYPDRDAERELLEGADRRDMIAGIDACLAAGELVHLQSMVKAVHVARPLLDYIQALVEHSRRSPEYATGLSPRAALALLHASRAWALIEGRDKAVPEDVQAVLPGVAGHRLRPVHDGVRTSSIDKANGLISAVPIPCSSTG